MEGNKKFRNFFILFTVVVGVIICLILLLLVVFFFIFGRRRNDILHHNKSFQYQEVQVSSNRTAFGLVKLNDRISTPDEYLSYSNDVSGGYVFISELGGSEYDCFGTCFCDDSTRRTAGVLSRSLFVFISAFSSATAMKMAQEAFENECSTSMAYVSKAKKKVKKCAAKKVKSKVDKCVRRANTENEHWREYFCQGYCVENEQLVTDTALDAMEEFGDCESVKTGGSMSVFCGRDGEGCSYKAKKKFVTEYLRTFCKSQSRITYDKFITSWEYEETKTNACVAQSRRIGFKNIECSRSDS